ncbi:MAG: hypothetical protein ACD_50C00179G0005 [uncultured bacterium]|nr:MAG: hypothetical protein ACD_50C00179G0005 [uncultured bacterium]
MKKPIVTPRENCISCGNCQHVAPEIFALQPDGKSDVLQLDDYMRYEDKINRAIQECPVQIIKWE